MPVAEDTEITLGTGRVLALFFGLVAVCAAFFGMGFKMGRNSITPAVSVAGSAAVPVVANPAARPSAIKPASDTNSGTANDVAFYKSGGQSSTAAQPASQSSGEKPASSSSTTAADDKATADPVAPPPLNGYYVQVAAVSKQEDGEALVDALKKKQYPAFATAGSDKLFHIQVGPFADIKSAEDMRAKLVADGYNPILKK